MVRRKVALIVLAVLAVTVVIGAVATGPRHALIAQDIPVGEEVMLASQGTPLAASLLRPETAAGRVPGVVMIVGSGSYSYRTSWKPGEFPIWKSISEAFLAKGWAVLLLEKKGVNRSGGHWETQTFHDRADDAIAGVRYLRSRPDIDPARVGVCGHSQGGWIAQLAAAEDPEEIAFVVSLAGPNVSVKRQIMDDLENEWRCAGLDEDKIASKSLRLQTRLDAYGTLSSVVRIGALSRILDYDPRAENVAARIRCPILAVYGEYDTLVLPETNRRLLEEGLATGGNTRATIIVIPKGGHGLLRKSQRCPEHFAKTPPLAPEFFQAVAAWDPYAG